MNQMTSAGRLRMSNLLKPLVDFFKISQSKYLYFRFRKCPLDDCPLFRIEAGPAPAEDQAAAARSGGEPHQEDQRPSPGRDLVSVNNGDDLGPDQGRENPGRQKRDPEDRQAPSPFANFNAVGRRLFERPGRCWAGIHFVNISYHSAVS